MSMGRGGMFGDPRSQVEKDMEARMLGLLSPDTQQATDQYAAMNGLLAPERPQGFWRGGGKFGVKDGIAGLLAAAGDALMAQAGMQGGAVEGLAGGRGKAQEAALKAQEEQRKRLTDRDEWKWRQDYTAKQPKGASDIEDNAGNVWRLHPDGTRELVFVDQNPRYNNINGMMVETTNAFRDRQPGYIEGGTSGGLPIPTLQEPDQLSQLRAEQERRRKLRLRQQSRDFLGGR